MMQGESPHVGIIDYGMGNLSSVRNALEHIGFLCRILHEPADIAGCTHLILPGVGAFGEAMENLRNHGWIDRLKDEVIDRQIPTLGICLGLQLFARSSMEFGSHTGLGFLEGEVVKIQPQDPSLRVPHIGWNNVSRKRDSHLFAGIPDDTDFYFVHSYCYVEPEPSSITGTCDYGGPVTASVEQGNVFAVQFHPEKSGRGGLRLLQNFCRFGEEQCHV